MLFFHFFILKISAASSSSSSSSSSSVFVFVFVFVIRLLQTLNPSSSRINEWRRWFRASAMAYFFFDLPVSCLINPLNFGSLSTPHSCTFFSLLDFISQVNFLKRLRIFILSFSCLVSSLVLYLCLLFCFIIIANVSLFLK